MDMVRFTIGLFDRKFAIKTNCRREGCRILLVRCREVVTLLPGELSIHMYLQRVAKLELL